MTQDEKLPGHPGHTYDLPSNGDNQGKQDLKVGHTMGLLKGLLVDERRTCPHEPIEC